MPTDFQSIIVYVIVGAILGGFLWQWRRRRKNPGCGQGCDCAPDVKRHPVIQKVVEEQQQKDR